MTELPVAKLFNFDIGTFRS